MPSWLWMVLSVLGKWLIVRFPEVVDRQNSGMSWCLKCVALMELFCFWHTINFLFNQSDLHTLAEDCFAVPIQQLQCTTRCRVELAQNFNNEKRPDLQI